MQLNLTPKNFYAVLPVSCYTTRKAYAATARTSKRVCCGEPKVVLAVRGEDHIVCALHIGAQV
jgi:hypothetical protein